jgi:predicted transcriptional regulator
VLNIKLYRKASTIFIIHTFLILNLIIINPEPFRLTESAEAIRYTSDTDLIFTDASFIGENNGDLSGYPVVGAGDVNGDGFDDILIGANLNSESGIEAGQVYLIFGKATGWANDTDLSDADATFLGEADYDWAGYSIASAGDVNKDGYDDILIGASFNDEGGPEAGQAYLIFGKSSGWSMDMPLSNASASFIGEESGDRAGESVAGIGDVNDDGLDDILIGAWQNDDGAENRGQAYIIFGKASGWANDTSLSNANASFLGETAWDGLGAYAAGLGDVNGDAIDDFMINAPWNDEGNANSGQVYVVFGKTSGWAMDDSISTANASFIDERMFGIFGSSSISGNGDVNNDGFDDILMGIHNDHDGGWNAGKVLLILGRSSGWEMDSNFSFADASFIGVHPGDKVGISAAIAEDLNGDGFDDILIGANGSNEGGLDSGKAYVIFGKDSGWKLNTLLSDADLSFIGEEAGDKAGEHIVGAGDVNGDGYNDILIGAHCNDENGNLAGQSYLIFLKLNFEPNIIYTLKLYSDAAFTDEITISEMNHIVYVELTGQDENASRADIAYVNISSMSTFENFHLELLETGLGSGTYRGFFRISDKTHNKLNLISSSIGDTITATAVQDPTKTVSILVSTPVQLRPLDDISNASEDEEYSVNYWVFGYNSVTQWIFDTNASWLTWDPLNTELYGTPANSEVGSFWVKINITDGLGHYDEHYFTLTVNNSLPEIINTNKVIAIEDEPFYLDYNSNDDGSGNVSWHLESNASWLELNSSSGELTGLPGNSQRGSYWVNISVNDGNGGLGWSNYTIIVANVNDPPVIVTDDVISVLEDALYYVDYEAVDIDGPTEFNWFLKTEAQFLKLDETTGILSGTPGNHEIGIYPVNITVVDNESAFDNHLFDLEVINVNDLPEWSNIPTDLEIIEGWKFIFDVNATDIDAGDNLVYGISSNPRTDISIDSESGVINWTASLKNLNFPFNLNVVLTVNDGRGENWTAFNIKVIPNTRPSVLLQAPADKSIVSSERFELRWIGFDNENESLTYDLYIHQSESAVENHLGNTRVLEGFNQTSYWAEDYEIGATYFWTVRPLDCLNYGDCSHGVFSFIINTPPSLSFIPEQETNVGKKFIFDMNAKDIDYGHVLNFEYRLNDAPEGMEIDSATGIITWNPNSDQVGKHTIQVSVTDGLDVTNSSFEITVVEKEVDSIITFRVLVIMTALSIWAIIIGLFVTATEVGRYKFFSSFYVPLYNKLRREKVLDNITRDKIHDYIKTKPGEQYTSIKVALKLKNGSLSHHLRILEKEEYVYSKRSKFSTRFYPKGTAEVPELLTPKLSEVQKKIIEIIRRRPGTTQNEVISILKRNQKTVSYNLTWLRRYDLIYFKQKGRVKKYYLNEKESESLSYRVLEKSSILTEPTVPEHQVQAAISSASGAKAALPPAQKPDQDNAEVPGGVNGTELNNRNKV